jgi:Flp pilus assembly protein TadB
MNRTDALKTLHVDPGADGHAVESAYWTLVRRAQRRAETDRSAWSEIEQLNEAYGALAPGGRRQRAQRRADTAATATGFAFLDVFADWVSAEALRTRVRWSGRNPEIALIGGAAIVLMVLALGAGASLAATFIVIGVLLAAIWAPWRRAVPKE